MAGQSKMSLASAYGVKRKNTSHVFSVSKNRWSCPSGCSSGDATVENGNREVAMQTNIITIADSQEVTFQNLTSLCEYCSVHIDHAKSPQIRNLAKQKQILIDASRNIRLFYPT